MVALATAHGNMGIARYRPEEVFAYVGTNHNFPAHTYLVRVNGDRFQLFKKQPRCVVCQVEGTVFILDIPPKLEGDKPHFNFYAETEDRGLVLMTKDHVIPRARNGKSVQGNYQTMCSDCNSKKGTDIRDYRNVFSAAWSVPMNVTLADVWRQIQKTGPSAVLLDAAGTTEMTQLAARKNPDLSWDQIFIRRDGWSLACSLYLAQYAEALHRDEWIAVVRRGDVQPKEVNFALDKNPVLCDTH